MIKTITHARVLFMNKSSLSLIDKPTFFDSLFLLLGVVIPNQAWAIDITYIPMAKGFLYLVAIIDWYSRKVLSWRLSNMMDTSFCIEALEEALKHYGPPDIFNSDQGSQFTST